MAQGGDTEQSYLPFLSAALFFVAGALKATWKLTVTLTQQDISWMANALFLLMAPGFVLTTFGAAYFAVAAYRLYQLLMTGDAHRGLRTAGLPVAR